MKNKNTELKETILHLYFDEQLPKNDILSRYRIGADTLDFWIKEKKKIALSQKIKKTTASSSYQSEADQDAHIFLKKENFLLDMPHYHESIEMICMLKGSATAHIGENVFKIKAGEICYCNKFQNHFYEKQSTNLEAICIVLGHDFTHHFRQYFKEKTPPFFMQNLDFNKEIIALVQKWLDEPKKTLLLNCAYSNLLFDVLSKTYSFYDIKKSGIEQIAVQFIDYIENNYNKDISLTSMAKHFGYAKEYCSKLFNKSVGQHFNTLLNSVRIKKVEEIMLSPEGTSRKVTDVLYECGFNNPVTFYRHYKTHKNAERKN